MISKKLIAQISKFVVIGTLNTGIDFAVLNLLIWWTGIYSGKWIILLNTIAFSVAVINSYFWNKHWTFKAEQEGESKIKEFSQYVAVTLVGLILNTAVVYLITTFIPPMFGTSKELWVNLAKVVATGVSLVWNFIGYKFIVFKK
ncbi:MAG: GtrA family protein [Candidatus Portnoybacteria bacterium]